MGTTTQHGHRAGLLHTQPQPVHHREGEAVAVLHSSCPTQTLSCPTCCIPDLVLQQAWSSIQEHRDMEPAATAGVESILPALHVVHQRVHHLLRLGVQVSILSSAFATEFRI